MRVYLVAPVPLSALARRAGHGMEPRAPLRRHPCSRVWDRLLVVLGCLADAGSQFKDRFDAACAAGELPEKFAMRAKPCQSKDVASGFR
jgi:hypothetical protein